MYLTLYLQCCLRLMSKGSLKLEGLGKALRRSSSQGLVCTCVLMLT